MRRVGFSVGALAVSLGACAVQPAPPLAPPHANAPAKTALTEVPWRVLAVNGVETPQQGDYFVRFATDGRVSAKFGCNSMGGTYRFERGVLTVSDLAQTLMGCPEPAGTFEQQGAAVLGAPMQVRMDARTGTPILSNAAGSIHLLPVVTGRRI